MLNQANEIERILNEKTALAEKISKNYLADLLRAMNMVKEGIQEKKTKIAKIENGMTLITKALEKLEQSNK